MEMMVQITSTSPPEGVFKSPSAVKSRSSVDSSNSFENIMRSRKNEEEETQEDAAAAAAAANQPADQMQALASLDQNESANAAGVASVTEVASSTDVATNAATIPVNGTAPQAPLTANTEGNQQVVSSETSSNPLTAVSTNAATPETDDETQSAQVMLQQSVEPEIPFTEGTGTDGKQQGALTVETDKGVANIVQPANIDETVLPTAAEEAPTTETTVQAQEQPAVQTSKTEEKATFQTKQAESGSGDVNIAKNSTPQTEEATITTVAGAGLETTATSQAAQTSFTKTETQITSLAQQIQEGVETSIQMGKSSVRIQLSPAELGAIDIRLISSGKGINLTVFAEQASTGRLLEAQISQLRQNLTDAGVQINNVNIQQQNLSNQLNPGYSQQQQQQGSQPQSSHLRRFLERKVDENQQEVEIRTARAERAIDYRA